MNRPKSRPRGRVRIIGGRWRRRQLVVADVAELRPTPDRVRETLFNWLADHVDGASCLDLFAGTGVLGFEAASRGAAQVVLVEREAALVKILEEQRALLGASEVRIVRADALAWLRSPATPFELVFVDPPFASGLVAPACAALQAGGWLAPGALVYVEHGEAEALPLPEGWSVHRERRAGRVVYALVGPPADVPLAQ